MHRKLSVLLVLAIIYVSTGAAANLFVGDSLQKNPSFGDEVRAAAQHDNNDSADTTFGNAVVAAEQPAQPHCTHTTSTHQHHTSTSDYVSTSTSVVCHS